MGTLLSSRFMTADQRQRCCVNGLSLDLIGYTLFTSDRQRIGVVDDILIDDESFAVRFLVADTSTAGFILNQPYALLSANLCCRDDDQRTVRVEATAGQVQSAPALDRPSDLGQSYEETIIFHYGERPFAPSDT